MESFVIDMLGLALRWLHMITGIAWIGASFYFIWLDNSLEEPPRSKKEMGIKGDLWSFHGGGIYEVAKYATKPEKMPKHLHWFYWEAYSTWITGILLMCVVYYFQASSYLVPIEGWVSSPTAAIFASLVFIASGVLVYEVLLRSGLAKRPLLFAIAMLLVLTLFSWISTHLFSNRAAYIHMGILLGTIMAANVYIGIIPPQRAFVKAIDAGTDLPVSGLVSAKLRSTHNNYFTLPVLFCMISNHYPVLYGHRYNWLILIAIFAIAAGSRQYFNLRHKGIHKPQIIAICLALFIGLCTLIGWDNYRQEKQLASMQVNTQRALTIAAEHCGICHSANPSFPGFTAPPLGILMSTEEQFRLIADKAIVSVSSQYMPLGNISGMTAEEREEFLSWLSQL